MDEEYEYGETLAYESIVGAFPGSPLSGKTAAVVQFLLFEGAIVALALVYRDWDTWAALAGTTAVFVATVGSLAMTTFADSVRALDPPEDYARLLFGSSIEVVFGLFAFIALVTYIFVVDPRSPPSLITTFLGYEPRAPVVFVTLLIAWDVCYRIGTGWWASITGLWRTYRHATGFDDDTRDSYVLADLLVIGFAAVQLLLVPFVLDHFVLVAALLGHVAAVGIVSGTSVLVSYKS